VDVICVALYGPVIHNTQPSVWKDDPLVVPFDIMAKIHESPGNNVCITGGEPTMQPPDLLSDLAMGLLEMGYTIDVFTNGSLVKFPLWMLNNDQVSVIMDWKLGGSGEAQRGVEIRIENLKTLSEKDNVKFVIADDVDFGEAVSLWNAFKEMTPAHFWVGCAWGKYNEAELIGRVLEEDLPWRVNVQVHKFIWPGVEKGI
jgi:7-carboxy-7-deazaguanine synthase